MFQGGTTDFALGSKIGGEVKDQGLWILGPNDPNWNRCLRHLDNLRHDGQDCPNPPGRASACRCVQVKGQGHLLGWPQRAGRGGLKRCLFLHVARRPLHRDKEDGSVEISS